jgi:hypothetical protein
MRAGTPLIAQAPLRDEVHQTYGMADLLVRSDYLMDLLADRRAWSPAEGLPDDELQAPATNLGSKAREQDWHYVALDIKFTGLELLKDGHAAKKHLAGAVQVWLYNEALGAMQGFTPSASYLLGRNWESGSGANTARGTGAFERLARVDRDHVFVARGTNNVGDQALAGLAQDALAWGRRLERDGAAWTIDPHPSVPELYPNMNNTEDFPWHGAKKKIAADLHELTLLPAIAPKDRTAALGHGFAGWDAPGLSAQSLGISTPARGRALTATLAARHGG